MERDTVCRKNCKYERHTDYYADNSCVLPDTFWYFKRTNPHLIMEKAVIKKFKTGDRIAAIQWINIESGSELEFAGYGTYFNREVPEDQNVTMFGISLKNSNLSRPGMLMDSGLKIYDCEGFSFVCEQQGQQYEKSISDISYIDQDCILQKRQQSKYKHKLA